MGVRCHFGCDCKEIAFKTVRNSRKRSRTQCARSATLRVSLLMRHRCCVTPLKDGAAPVMHALAFAAAKVGLSWALWCTPPSCINNMGEMPGELCCGPTRARCWHCQDQRH